MEEEIAKASVEGSNGLINSLFAPALESISQTLKDQITTKHKRPRRKKYY
jgi:hypothetical protein